MSAPRNVDLDPREYVDREEQQTTLTDMVAGRREHRALLISDWSGQGKSHLMVRLRHNCLADENRPSVLFVDVRDLTAAFGVMQRSIEDSRNLPALVDHFTYFRAEYASWQGTARVDVGGQSGSIRVDANHTHVGDAGSIIGLHVTGRPAGLDSTAAHVGVLAGFQRDLTTPRHRKLVVMVDHYNRADPQVQAWINDALLGPCLQGDLPNVIVVLASTPDHRPVYPERLAELVCEGPLARLADDPQHVQSLLKAHRIVTESSGDVGEIEKLVTQAISLLQEHSIYGLLTLYHSRLGGAHGT